MNKRITPVEKAARLLDLVPYIYSHQGIALDDLASEFAISKAELLSDLNTLWMCGESRFDFIDLEFESGFVSIRNAEVVNIVRSLSAQEVTAILFGLDILRESLESERPDLLADIAGIKEKIGKSLDRSITGEPGVSGLVSAAINLALKNREKLNITYHSLARDELSKRVVHPIERRLEDGFEILLAFCEEADALRTFRLDRITNAIRVESPSQPVSIVNSIDRIRVKIRVHSDHREVFEALGDLQPNPDGTFVVDVYNQSWLIREVLASAGSIEVIEPVELRHEIARQAAGIAAQYR